MRCTYSFKSAFDISNQKYAVGIDIIFDPVRSLNYKLQKQRGYHSPACSQPLEARRSP